LIDTGLVAIQLVHDGIVLESVRMSLDVGGRCLGIGQGAAYGSALHMGVGKGGEIQAIVMDSMLMPRDTAHCLGDSVQAWPPVYLREKVDGIPIPGSKFWTPGRR